MNETRKTLLTGFVIDATLSFSSVYAQIYYLIERLMMSLQNASEKYDTEVRYGVTLIRDNPETFIFGNNEAFSDNAGEVINRLTDIYFYGGGSDGSEDINAAITSMLGSMADYEDRCRDGVQKVMMLFTDSVPSDRNMFPDLTDTAAGVNAAYIYSYTDDYMPMLQVTGKNGAISENNSGKCVFESLGTILEWSESEALTNMEDLAEEILDQIR